MPERQLVYLTGSGRSGSTLLDMALGRHSAIAALGEVHRLTVNAHREGRAFGCTCGQPVSTCPFWVSVAEELSAETGIPAERVFREWHVTDPAYTDVRENEDSTNIVENVPQRYPLSPNRLFMGLGSPFLLRTAGRIFPDVRLHAKIARQSLALYDAVRRASGKPIVVDATKSVARLKGLQMAFDGPFRIIYLIRDGRAVAFARMKRQKLPMNKCAHIWLSEHRKISWALRGVPTESIIRVRYEDFCRNPRQELERLCRFFGVELENQMLDFRTDSHSIGGNPMRWRRDESKIVLNEEWKNAISTSQQDEFESIAGAMNAAFG